MKKTVVLIMDEENDELLQTLLRGSWGSRVREAQRKLINLNLLWDNADGNYGVNTETAVSLFERKMEEFLPGQTKADGRLAPAEYTLLMSDLSEYGFEAPIYFDDKHPETLKGEYLSARNGYTAEGHYTTARDLVIAARNGMTQPLFSKIVTCMKYTLPATENRDELVLTLKWEIFDPDSEYYIPHAAGIKSGYTSSAGFCYVGAYQENGVTLIASVMGNKWRNMAWTDLRRLFAYGMKTVEDKE